MSDLQLLEAIEALAREIAQRPARKWSVWVMHLVYSLRDEFYGVNRDRGIGGKPPAADFIDDVLCNIQADCAEEGAKLAYDTVISFESED